MRKTWMFLFLCLPTIAIADVSGAVEYAGESWKPVDALAYTCDEGGACVVIGATKFDRDAFLADGVIDSVDVHERQPDGARYLVLSFDTDGILRDVGAYGPNGGSNQSDESMLSAFTLSAFDATHVAGAIEYADDSASIAVRFDAAMVSAQSKQ